MGTSSLEIGCRIYCDGEYGTVLYIGSLDGVEGLWLGIEWDNPCRGKHSGCYNGVSYFTTRISNAGSFVKISKVQTGISCPNALKLKYGRSSDSKPATFFNLPQKTGGERHIEMVGMEKIMGKQSNFQALSEVVLSAMLINGPGDENELKELIPNVRNLDLTQNLLSSWSDLVSIVKQLPALSTLILSKNRLKLPAHLKTVQDCFASLNTIVLNDVGCCWKEILSCAVMWPFIIELLIIDNNISELEVPLCPIFSKLKFLSLDNNPIVSWTEICKLGNLINLEELHLENISLNSISFPEASPLEKTELFPNLKTLFIRNNNLKQWQDISELNKLKRLKSLMVSGNPVIQSVSKETARQFIIAKILGLEVLNRSKIERSEKRGAELDYLKLHNKDWIASGGSLHANNGASMTFLTQHPTYCNLLQKHGAADVTDVDTERLVLNDNLIRIRIFSPLFPDIPPVMKKLPTEMTVGKLKALVQRLFKVGAQSITLTVIFKQNESQRTLMDNDLRQLSFYSISNEDKIEVQW